MTDYINYYEILEVPESATRQEIQEAFRKLAQQYHPDKIPTHLTRLRKEAEEKFKQINEAYRVLSDPQTRAQYDNLLRTFRQQSNTSSPSSQATTVPPVAGPVMTPQRNRFYSYRTILSFAGIVLVGIILIVLFINKVDRQPTKSIATTPKVEAPPSSGMPQKPEAGKRTTSSATTSAAQARVRPILGAAYSYSKERWAGLHPFWKGYFPEIHLTFSSGLIVDYATIEWKGSYNLSAERLCLTINNLKVPNSGILTDFYTDIGVGYSIQLDNAVFTDYTLAKTLILFRTFAGDSPPPTIEKCFDIKSIENTGIQNYNISGEWSGIFDTRQDDGSKARTNFVGRFIQEGNRFEGVILDYQSGNPNAPAARARVEGLVVDDKITFLKIYKGQALGISYVASFHQGIKSLQGFWLSGLQKGDWSMAWRGTFTGSPDDILSPDVRKPN
jgi:curved DNA-binding protein CbpA